MNKNNNYTKDFKYTIKSKNGKILFQSVVTFGSKTNPFPKDWKDNPMVQISLQEYKEKIIKDNLDIEISEFDNVNPNKLKK